MKMSAIFKRPGDADGIEMPLKEAVTREMLSVMFGLDGDQVLHIFNSDGVEETVLLLTESYFTPQKPGNYTVKMDSDDIDSVNIGAANEFQANNFGFWSFKADPLKKPGNEAPLLSCLLKRPGSEAGIKVTEPIAKEMVRELFGLDETEKLIFLNEYGHVVKTLPAERSLWNEENFFSPQSPGTFVVFMGKEDYGAEEDDSTKAKAVMTQHSSMFQNLPPHLFIRILNTMSGKEFLLLAMTCHEMVEILDMDGVGAKEIPFNLNVMEQPNGENFSCFITHKEETDSNGVPFHLYYLNALKPFRFEALKAKGQNTPQQKNSLLAACELIQKQNVAYKTFYSDYNRLPTVLQMLEILKPKKAEIWLVHIHQDDGQIRPFGEGFTGMEWPFENVGEELKLVMSDFDCLLVMNRTRGIIHFISHLKIFQAFSARAPSFLLTADLLKEFLEYPEMGKLQMVQFVYPEEINANVDLFDGIDLYFDEGNQVQSLDLFEQWPRVRAGIRSKNMETIAVVESRKYPHYRSVTVAFIAMDGFKEQLGRIYKDIDELHQTVDLIFKR